MSDSPAVLPGAEPFSAPSTGSRAGVLVLHGFTGNPSSMRPLAERFAAAGFAVELPRLPGHGTTVDDMLTTTWVDWSSAAERAYEDLAARVDKVVVAGLSMGGTLVCWLAARHPEIAGVVAVNPAVEPVAPEFVEMMRESVRQGTTIVPGIGSDIAKPGSVESAYPGTPIPCLITLLEAQIELAPTIAEIRCPILLLNSPQDHVVPPSNGDWLVEHVSGPVERVALERSYHVATLDWDAEEIETRAVDFAKKVTAG